MPQLRQSDAAQSFFTHWRSLAPAGGIPTLSNYLDRASFAHQPMIGMVDVATADQLPIRYFGTGLVAMYNRDLTGTDALAIYAPETRAALGRACLLMVTTPCGRTGRRTLKTAGGVTFDIVTTALPVSRGKGQSGCLVCYFEMRDITGLGDSVASLNEIDNMMWLDLGLGLPAIAQGMPSWREGDPWVK